MISLKVLMLKWKTQSVLRFVLSGLCCFLSVNAFGGETFRAEAVVSEQPVPQAPPPLASVLAQKPVAVLVPPPPIIRKTKPQVVSKIKRILPLITFYNAIDGEVYNWWAENAAPKDTPSLLHMQRLSKKIMTELLKLQDQPWVYGVSSEEIKNFPQNLKKTALSPEEIKTLSLAVGTTLVVEGDVSFHKSPIIEKGFRMKVHLKALNPQGGVSAGEVIRISDLHSWEYDGLLFAQSKGLSIEAFAELHEQMKQVKKDIRPNYVRLLVTGRLSYAQLELLKQKISRSVKGVRSIRSETIENEQVALLVDYEGKSSQAFGQSLAQTQFGAFLTQVVSTDSDQVLFDVLWRGR